jgi:hypothetical protein
LTSQFRDGTEFSVEWRTDSIRPALSTLSRRTHQAAARVLIRDDTGYNCAGLAFASRRGWYGDEPTPLRLVLPNEPGYMSDFHESIVRAVTADGYRSIARSEARIGDLVTYATEGQIQHVAQVVGTEPGAPPATWVVSKFGSFGEYLHAVENVPSECGNIDRVWTART